MKVCVVCKPEGGCMSVRFDERPQPKARGAGGRRLPILVLALTALLGAAQSSFAQTDEGRLAGLVTDSSGGVVPGATVTARNERTGDERTTTTSTQGRFVLAGLKPSLYTVRADLAGF